MSTASLSSISVLLSCLLATSVTKANDHTLTIGLIGDSTVATTYGWGPAFGKEIRETVNVLNYAKNGATLASLSKQLEKLLAAKPDYVLIQFGHNDMKNYDTQAYGKKLADYIERIIRSGSKPIVLSSVTRRNFDEQGRIKPAVINGRTLPEFALSAKAVAKESNVPFVDLNTISIAHHNKIGPEASAAYNFKETDKTHFSKKGATAISALLISELKAVVPELASYFE